MLAMLFESDGAVDAVPCVLGALMPMCCPDAFALAGPIRSLCLRGGSADAAHAPPEDGKETTFEEVRRFKRRCMAWAG